MKKILTLLTAVFVLTFTGMAQVTQVIPMSTDKSGFTITENSHKALKMNVSHSQIVSFSVETQKGTFSELSISGARFTGNVGDPKLPAYSRLIEVPFGADVEVKVTDYTVEEYKLSDFGIENLIIPAQPDISKCEGAVETAEFKYNENAYAAKGYTDYEMANVTMLGTMRGVQVANIAISPVNYNPSTGMIKVFNNMKVEVNFKNADIAKTEQVRTSTYSPFFEPVYQKLLNYKGVIEDHPDLTKYPVKMIILADRMFESTLQPYIEWKTKKGFEVIVNYTDEGYNSVAAIETWIMDHYNAGTPDDPAPSFCLFVGDVAQIPYHSIGTESGKATDLYYFSQDGDYFPEIYYGRFSANNVAELQPQIDKTLYHEQYLFSDPTYLDDVTLIAGADGTWNPNVGQATVQYGTQNYFNASYGFSTVNAYLDSYSGCYENERISVSFINYTAHCNESVWDNPHLGISDIAAMTNTDKYPLAVGNCCLSAEFATQECIGEAWVRAANKGAVAYIGSSPSSYWFEDFYWSVGAFPISGNNNGYVPTTAETTLGVYDAMFISNYVTVDASIFLGNLAVTEVDVQGYPQHSNPTYYWEAYNCLGDPSLVPYYTQGEVNTVSHMPTLPIGVGEYEVTAEAGSYVAISKDGVLHGAALVGETGVVTVDLVPILSGGDVDIVVTKPQYQPYMTTVPAASLEGPYVVFNEYEIDGGDFINYGATADIDITLKNVGPDQANTVTATVTTSDEYVESFTNNEDISFGDIAGNDGTATSSGNFTLTVADNVPDNYMIPFDVTVTDANDSVWTSSFTVTAYAPVITIGNLEIVNDDNNDGRIDPGESAEIIIYITNEGHAEANNPEASLVGDCAYFTVSNAVQQLGSIAPDAEVPVAFNVSASNICPEGTPVELTFTVTEVESVSDIKNIVIGQPPQITIGDGTTEITDYPFNTYYENNISHMLYLGSEIGAGTVNIQEIAFDFTSLNSEISELTNFQINFKQTDLTALGNAYPDMAGATTVLAAASFTMPTETGWHVIDIDDFEVNTDQNLIIEIVWGDNGDWASPACSVNGTAYSDVLVTYGYADSETPPNYDGNSSTRPNIMLYFEGEAPAPSHNVEFVVTDVETNNPIEDATVTVGSLTQNTNASGIANFTLIESDYSYSADADGYAEATGTFTVDGEETITVELTDDESVVTLEDFGINVFPNPVIDFLYVSSKEVIEKYEVCDMGGKVLMQDRVFAKRFKIDFTSMGSSGGFKLKVYRQEDKSSFSTMIIVVK